MGKHKLCFDQRKNYERNRRSKHLIVAIPVDLVIIHHNSRHIPVDSTGSLILNLPLSIYSSASVRCYCSIHKIKEYAAINLGPLSSS